MKDIKTFRKGRHDEEYPSELGCLIIGDLFLARLTVAGMISQIIPRGPFLLLFRRHMVLVVGK